MSRAKLGLLGLVMGLFFVVAVPAGAAVERYQFKTLDYTVTYYVGITPYTQTFTVTPNPCDGTFSGDGNQPVWGATWTQGAIDGTTISYTTEYMDSPKPYGASEYIVTVTNATYDPATNGFSGTWTDTGPGPGGDVVATAVVTATTSYNHGEYVAESIDEYGPDAHSCIGMPITSKGHSG